MTDKDAEIATLKKELHESRAHAAALTISNQLFRMQCKDCEKLKQFDALQSWQD